jgi:CelD/BcsL family acetyltransferase involved in cellulose biosynthesis
MKRMANTVVVESFNTIDAYVDHPGDVTQGQHVFLLPRWIQTWRQAFKPDDELHVCLIKKGGELIGIAPLSITGKTASFVGDPEVCDYFDFAVTPGYEKEFYHALLDNLSRRGVTELNLRCLRPESTVLSHLGELVKDRNGKCSLKPDGVSLEMELPGGWTEYLNMLDGKQRHEIRRKSRRLDEKGETEFLVLKDAAEITEQLDNFLKMFRESREDKLAFMNPQMESFFRSMIQAMSEEGILRLFFLKLDEALVAAALCFDYQDTVYLYNSGYDPRYSSLSVGLLCKILSIRHSIRLGRKKYDFLKGAEAYKSQLGGKEIQLSKCRIVFG